MSAIGTGWMKTTTAKSTALWAKSPLDFFMEQADRIEHIGDPAVADALFLLRITRKVRSNVVALGGYEDYSHYFINPMEKYDDVEISHIPNHLVLGQFPQTLDQLKKFDVVIISDCGLLQVPEWMGKLTAFGYVPDVPLEPMGALRTCILLLVAAGFILLGLIGYRRRDVYG